MGDQRLKLFSVIIPSALAEKLEMESMFGGKGIQRANEGVLIFKRIDASHDKNNGDAI